MEQLAKNQLHTAEITGYTSDGAGVCHIAGRAVFVKGALAGETWQVRILKVTANAVYGKAEQCLSPAPARTQPPCPVYRTCGGCSLQHMDYDEQLRMKLQRVNDALTRIGGVSMPVQDIIGMEYPLCYRNKAIYAVGTKDGRVVKGFYRASSHDITPVEQCLLQLPLADKAAQAVCDWMDLRGVAPYDEATGRGTVRHLFTRCAMHTPDAVLCIVSARGFGAQTDDLIAYLREHCPELTGIVLDVNKQKGNVVLAGDFYTLWGEPELTDRLCGLTFTLSPQAFYQVNHAQAPVHQAAGIGSSHAMRQGQKSDLRPSSGNRLHIGIRKLQTGTRNLTETGKNLPQRLPGILAGSSAHQLHPAMVQQDAQQFLPGVATGPDDCNLNLLHDKKGML